MQTKYLYYVFLWAYPWSFKVAHLNLYKSHLLDWNKFKLCATKNSNVHIFAIFCSQSTYDQPNTYFSGNRFKVRIIRLPLNILKCTLIFFNARYSMYTILLLFSNSTESISNVCHKGAENKLECLRTVAVVRRCSVKKFFLDIS